MITKSGKVTITDNGILIEKFEFQLNDSQSEMTPKLLALRWAKNQLNRACEEEKTFWLNNKEI